MKTTNSITLFLTFLSLLVTFVFAAPVATDLVSTLGRLTLPTDKLSFTDFLNNLANHGHPNIKARTSNDIAGNGKQAQLALCQDINYASGTCVFPVISDEQRNKVNSTLPSA
jgi:hypothetical protein